MQGKIGAAAFSHKRLGDGFRGRNHAMREAVGKRDLQPPLSRPEMRPVYDVVQMPDQRAPGDSGSERAEHEGFLRIRVKHIVAPRHKRQLRDQRGHFAEERQRP